MWMCIITIYSHIQGCGACSESLYIPYTAIYRAAGPALRVCICHMHHMQGCGASSVGVYMPYTAYTGLWWDQLCGSDYAIFTIYSHIQGFGATSVGLKMPNTAIDRCTGLWGTL